MTAAITHLAHSTPARDRFTATDFNSYVTTSVAEGGGAEEGRAHGGGRSAGVGGSAANRGVRRTDFRN